MMSLDVCCTDLPCSTFPLPGTAINIPKLRKDTLVNCAFKNPIAMLSGQDESLWKLFIKTIGPAIGHHGWGIVSSKFCRYLVSSGMTRVSTSCQASPSMPSHAAHLSSHYCIVEN